MRAHIVPRLAFTAALVAGGVGQAAATEGYFQTGYGIVQKAEAGAGVANPQDAMALSINPAGLVDLPQMVTGGVSAFMPYRQYTATGQGFFAPGAFSGTVQSGRDFFVMPIIAYSSPIDATTAWGVAAFGNGGMDTNYPNVFNANCPLKGGIYCGGPTGVDLKQMFITVGVAKSFGPISVGIAPVLAIQTFAAKGMSFWAFPQPMWPSSFSANPWNMTDAGTDWSFGGGARVGAEWKVMPWFRVGVSGQTPLLMTAFSKYAGLFADGGRFNIPANITAGVAWDVIPTITLMAEYKHIFYTGVPAIANTGASIIVPMFAGPGVVMGGAGGPGFGWKDVDVYTVGAEWRVTPEFSLRAGYAHNTNPVKWNEVSFNILAPGIVTDHITGGFGWKITPSSSFDFALTYVPTRTVTGPQMTPFGYNPMGAVTLSMHQWEASLGYSYKFASAPVPVVTKY